MTINEHPILFSGEMVRAILAGRKTQTRRIIKPQPAPLGSLVTNTGEGDEGFIQWCDIADIDRLVSRDPESHWHTTVCRYAPGDLLWVRETWWDYGKWVNKGEYRHENEEWASLLNVEPDISIQYAATTPNRPDWFSASYEDDNSWHREKHIWRKRPSIFMPRWASRINLEVIAVRAERLQEITDEDAIAEGFDGVTSFSLGWDSINGKRGYTWDRNPFVWVIEFPRYEP